MNFKNFGVLWGGGGGDQGKLKDNKEREGLRREYGELKKTHGKCPDTLHGSYHTLVMLPVVTRKLGVHDIC